MNIFISDETERLDNHYSKDIRFVVYELLKKLEMPETTEISVLFTDDKNMRKLNRSYRNIDKTTDVLSFPQGFDDDNHVLGDILISLDSALRQAETYQVDTENEIERLLVHGILHLLGYDHMEKRERMIMREKENNLIIHINNL